MNGLDLSNITLPEIKAGVEDEVWLKLAVTIVVAVIFSSISFFLIKKAFV